MKKLALFALVAVLALGAVYAGAQVAAQLRTERFFSYANDATPAAGFVCENAGCLVQAGALGVVGRCDSTGSPGNATCNRAAGRAAIAAGASSVTIVNSLVTTSSSIFSNLQTTDATCLYVKSVVPAAGNFIVNSNANCTANANLTWVVVN